MMFSKRCSDGIVSCMLTTYDVPSVEYASTVWDPSTEKYTKAIENFQRQAARFVMNDYRRRSMLESLEWKSLERRRADAKLVMLYRINHKLVDVTAKSLAAAPARTSTHQRQRLSLLPDFHPRRRLQILILPQRRQTMEQEHIRIS